MGTPQIWHYPVKNKNQLTPAVIIIPGGGYSFLSFDKEGIEIANWFNSFDEIELRCCFISFKILRSQLCNLALKKYWEAVQFGKEFPIRLFPIWSIMSPLISALFSNLLLKVKAKSIVYFDWYAPMYFLIFLNFWTPTSKSLTISCSILNSLQIWFGSLSSA